MNELWNKIKIKKNKKSKNSYVANNNFSIIKYVDIIGIYTYLCIIYCIGENGKEFLEKELFK